MGVLSDFVSAPAGAGASIGEAVRPADHWQVLEGWKGIDPVKLATLHSLIVSESLDVDPIVAKSGTFELVGGDEADGPWVMVFPTRNQSLRSWSSPRCKFLVLLALKKSFR